MNEVFVCLSPQEGQVRCIKIKLTLTLSTTLDILFSKVAEDSGIKLCHVKHVNAYTAVIVICASQPETSNFLSRQTNKQQENPKCSSHLVLFCYFPFWNTDDFIAPYLSSSSSSLPSLSEPGHHQGCFLPKREFFLATLAFGQARLWLSLKAPTLKGLILVFVFQDLVLERRRFLHAWNSSRIVELASVPRERIWQVQFLCNRCKPEGHAGVHGNQIGSVFHFGSSLGFHLQHTLRLGVISWSAGDLVNLHWSATLLSLFTACFGAPSIHLARYVFMRLRCLVAGV